MEDHELARRAELGLNVERIKKNRALNRNTNMAGLNAYLKVFHLSQIYFSNPSGKKRLAGLSDFIVT